MAAPSSFHSTYDICRFRIPDKNGIHIAGNNLFCIGTEMCIDGTGGAGAPVAFVFFKLFSCRHVKQEGGFVTASGQQGVPVPAHFNRSCNGIPEVFLHGYIRGIGMVLLYPLLLLQVPAKSMLLFRSYDNGFPVRHEGCRKDAVPLQGDLLNKLAGRDIPYFQTVILIYGGKVFPQGAKNQVTYIALIAKIGTYLTACGTFPQLDGFVRAACGCKFAVRTVCHRGHGRIMTCLYDRFNRNLL